MIFADLSSGDAVFLDANTLIYHFGLHPQFGAACTALVDRIDSGDLRGFASTSVLSDVAHRLMPLEAMSAFGWPYAGIAPRMKKHPAQV